MSHNFCLNENQSIWIHLLYTVVHVFYIKLLEISTATIVRSTNYSTFTTNQSPDWLKCCLVALNSGCIPLPKTPEYVSDISVCKLSSKHDTRTYTCVKMRLGTSSAINRMTVVNE